MIPTVLVTRCGVSALVYLVDTSVFTRIVRTPVADAMERLAPLGLRHSHLTALELRFSASSEAEWDLFESAVSEYERVPVTPQDLNRADVVQRALAGQGLKGRKPVDLIIAAQAERLRLTVVHYDKDFEFIASITDQPHEWIVPRGTIN
jgi:predicted nucleic acid-binding protein